MIPFATRKRTPNSSGATNLYSGEMISKLPRSPWRRCRIPLTAKCGCVFFIVLSVYIYGMSYWAWGSNRLTKEEFLEINKCPSCYGTSMCFSFFDDQYSLAGLSKYEMFDIMNLKNVHFAYHRYHGHNVVIKKLAHDAEINRIDAKICEDSFRRPGCDLARTTVVTQTAKDIHRYGLQPKHLLDTSFMFTCPSHKLVDKVVQMYKERSRPEGRVALDDKLQIVFTAKVNPEPLLLQTFPRSEGWPFPEYYGACGRYIVVENGGKTLAEYFNAPFEKRADLAYQMLAMAKQLTDHPEWNLYWTDLAYENFAVDPSGKLTAIDVENIIVVDKQAVKIANQDHWQEFHQTHFDDCRDARGEQENCLTFDTQELCTHHLSDLNFYTTCRNMLWKHAHEEFSGRMGGLLHDMPEYATTYWDLENLLFECVKPTSEQGRVNAALQIMDALAALSNRDDVLQKHDKKQAKMADNKMAENKMADNKMANKMADIKMAENKMAGNKLTNNKMADGRVVDNKLSNDKMFNNKVNHGNVHQNSARQNG